MRLFILIISFVPDLVTGGTLRKNLRCGINAVDKLIIPASPGIRSHHKELPVQNTLFPRPYGRPHKPNRMGARKKGHVVATRKNCKKQPFPLLGTGENLSYVTIRFTPRRLQISRNGPVPGPLQKKISKNARHPPHHSAPAR